MQANEVQPTTGRSFLVNKTLRWLKGITATLSTTCLKAEVANDNVRMIFEYRFMMFFSFFFTLQLRTTNAEKRQVYSYRVVTQSHMRTRNRAVVEYSAVGIHDHSRKDDSSCAFVETSGVVIERGANALASR